MGAGEKGAELPWSNELQHPPTPGKDLMRPKTGWHRPRSRHALGRDGSCVTGHGVGLDPPRVAAMVFGGKVQCCIRARTAVEDGGDEWRCACTSVRTVLDSERGTGNGTGTGPGTWPAPLIGAAARAPCRPVEAQPNPRARCHPQACRARSGRDGRKAGRRNEGSKGRRRWASRTRQDDGGMGRGVRRSSQAASIQHARMPDDAGQDRARRVRVGKGRVSGGVASWQCELARACTYSVATRRRRSLAASTESAPAQLSSGSANYKMKGDAGLHLPQQGGIAKYQHFPVSPSARGTIAAKSSRPST